MKILVTNDDGITSQGLAVAVQWAATVGQVTVCAPQTQQSGKSHAITIHQPFPVQEVSLGLGECKAYAVGSTPVDCVRFATLGLNQTYDLVISGVNKGYNLGEDILYSGTVGAIFEAGLRNTRGIAFSTEHTSFEHAQQWLPAIFNYFFQHKLLHQHPIFNVNIPPNPQGILLTHQGGPYFSDRFSCDEQGNWQQNGYCVHQNLHDHTQDTDATIDGFVTVTPLSLDRSDIQVWHTLVQKTR